MEVGPVVGTTDGTSLGDNDGTALSCTVGGTLGTWEGLGEEHWED